MRRNRRISNVVTQVVSANKDRGGGEQGGSRVAHFATEQQALSLAPASASSSSAAAVAADTTHDPGVAFSQDRISERQSAEEEEEEAAASSSEPPPSRLVPSASIQRFQVAPPPLDSTADDEATEAAPKCIVSLSEATKQSLRALTEGAPGASGDSNAATADAIRSQQAWLREAEDGGERK